MNVGGLLKQLALGELSNLSLAENGLISDEKIPKILMYANEGLFRLHTRFVLKEKSLILEMREEVTNYHLLKRFAYSEFDPQNPPSSWNMPYIMDLGDEPFLEDVIKVLSVYDYNGCKLPINDLELANSVFTPQPLVLQVPNPIQSKTLSVEYQAKHEPIPNEEYDDILYDDILIDIPECLESALLSYIAYKAYMHMNTAESTAKGQEHAMNFEILSQGVIDMDLVNTASSTTNTRFEKRGWI